MMPRPGSAAVNLEILFCERCGRDRDALLTARAALRECQTCGTACCPDCWNLVESGCLVCAPFRLHAATSRSRIVPAQGDPAAAGDRTTAGVDPAVDPYADLRDEPVRSRQAGGASAADRLRRRPGRIGLAAVTAWFVAGVLALAALAATPGRATSAPPAVIHPEPPVEVTRQ
jgi:hypothetical protein